jgi:hypothetical protein
MTWRSTGGSPIDQDGTMIHSVIPPGASGPPVLFVHGAWHAAWCWQGWMSRLGAAGIPSHAIDLPRHGRPGDRRRRWTGLGSYASAVVEAIDLLGPRVVVGHSMGGLVCQRALERRTVDLGVLLASVPPSGVASATLRTLRRAPRAVVGANVMLSMWPIVATSALARQAFFTPETDEAVVWSTWARLENESYPAYLEMMLVRARPGRVSTPMRVMAADGDGIFTLDEQRTLAAAYGVEVAVIERSGHDIMLDSPADQAADMVVDWVREAGSGGQ